MSESRAWLYVVNSDDAYLSDAQRDDIAGQVRAAVLADVDASVVVVTGCTVTAVPR